MQTPLELKLHKKSATLEIVYSPEKSFNFSAEFLRVYSPSAEVRGHGPGQEILQYGKKQVGIEKLEAVGTYAIKIGFDDGHNSGIYSWDYLAELGANQNRLWNDYLKKLIASGKTRESLPEDTQVITLKPSPIS